MSKFRVIQAGVGGFGKVWLGALPKSADFELVALVDISPKALEEAGAVTGIGKDRHFASLEQALNSVKADVLVTSTPPAVHLEHTRLATAAGLHVVTEKPMSVDMASAKEMARLAKAAGRHLLISQNYRFQPAMATLRRLVRETKPLGELGHFHLDFYIPADFTGTFRETMEHVLLVDMAVHHLDLVRSITGRNITRVYARTFKPAWSWYGHNAGLKMTLDLEGNVFGSYSGDWSGKGRNTDWAGDWRLQCAEGSIHFDRRLPNRIVLARSSRGFSDDVIEQTMLLDPVPNPGQQGTLALLAHAIRTGETVELSAESNLWSFGAVMAGVQSAETGQPVDVPSLLA